MFIASYLVGGGIHFIRKSYFDGMESLRNYREDESWGKVYRLRNESDAVKYGVMDSVMSFSVHIVRFFGQFHHFWK
jgi:hypothetical protein